MLYPLIVLRPDSGDGGLVLPQIAKLLTESFIGASAKMTQQHVIDRGDLDLHLVGSIS